MTASTKFLVARLPVGQRLPVTRTLTTSAAAAIGATSLTVTATNFYVEAERTFVFAGQTVTAAANVPVGGTTIPLTKPLATGIATAITSSPTYELFEFIGGESVDLGTDLNTISIRNFRSGAWTENSKVSYGVSLDLEGQFHIEDRSIQNVIRPAVFTLGEGNNSPEVYVDFIRPNGDRYAGAFLVMDYAESLRLDDIVRVSFTLSSQGAITIPAPLSLLT